jgi:hypothetical protein
MTGDSDDASEELDFAALKQREQQKRQTTKEFAVEYDDGLRAVFEYQMIDGIDEIAGEHTRRKPTRSGQEDEYEVTDKYGFARDILKAGLVDAPEGFEITKRTLEEDLTDELVDDLVDAITEFSSMDEVTVRKFRGLGVRE